MKKHKIDFTQDELQKLSLCIGFYGHLAEEMDSMVMLVNKQVLTRVRKLAVQNMFLMQFSNKKMARLTLEQIEIDLIWECFGTNTDLREVLLKIGSKVHTYTN